MKIDPFDMLWNAFLPILTTFTGGLVTDTTTLMIAMLIIFMILIAFDIILDVLTGSERTLAGFREQQRLRRIRNLEAHPSRRTSDSEIEVSPSNLEELENAYRKSRR
jgi:hypothetical protein